MLWYKPSWALEAFAAFFIGASAEDYSTVLRCCRCHPNIVQTFTYIIKPSTTSVAQCPSDGDE